jgi:hypothetical protein
MFRTYRISPNRRRYTPILEIIRRRAEELERVATEQPASARTRSAATPQRFFATA